MFARHRIQDLPITMSKRTQDTGCAPEPKRPREAKASTDEDETGPAESDVTERLSQIDLIEEEAVAADNHTPATEQRAFIVPQPYRCVLDFIMEGDRHETRLHRAVYYHIFYDHKRVVGFCPGAVQVFETPEIPTTIREHLRECNVLLRQGVSFEDLFKLSLDRVRDVPCDGPPSGHAGLRKHSEDFFLQDGVSDVNLEEPFSLHFVVKHKGVFVLYMAEKSQNTFRLLQEIRGMTEYGQVLPQDNHKVLRTIAHFELYRNAILIFGEPNKILQLRADDLKLLFERKLTPYQVIVYLVRNKNLAFNLLLDNFQIDYGEELLSAYSGDTKELNFELCNWCTYLRTGNYFLVVVGTPLHSAVCRYMTSDKPVFTKLDEAHQMLQGSSENDDASKFLLDVSNHLPWHPPIIANPVNSKSSVDSGNYAPTWWLMDQYEVSSYYNFVSNSKRCRKVQKDALFWWNYPNRIMKRPEINGHIAGGVPDLEMFLHNCQRKAFESSHKVDFDMFKDKGNCLIIVLFILKRVLKFECDARCISAKLGKNEQVYTNVILKYRSLFGLSAKQEVTKRHDLRVNVVAVFKTESLMKADIKKPSGKYPHMSRMEAIARTGLGDVLYNLYKPSLYHTFEKEFTDKFYA